MTVDVSETTVIERPIAEVAAYAGDPSNAPEWYRRISSAEWRTDPPIMLGSQIEFRARFLGSLGGRPFGEHDHALFFANPVGQHNRAAHNLVCLGMIHAQSHGNLNRLVKLGRVK